MQLRHTESAIKSKLIELLAQLKVFKFMATLGLVFKTTLFIQTQKQKKISMKVLLIMYLNQSILQLCQISKISLEKGSRCIIDSVIDHNISTSKYNR